MPAFSFSFSGDDIEEDVSSVDQQPQPASLPSHAAETGSLRRAAASAFPIAGQTLLEPQSHDLETMLKALPSMISYSTLVVKLDDGKKISLPRRELWDVRVQLMAEEDDEGLGNLGQDDVRTGIYEGGFKSWESSVDVVKVLNERRGESVGSPTHVLELGCGTALPSMSLFQWFLESSSTDHVGRFDLGLADYNPTVLQLVTLPNIILSWAQVTRKELWEIEGELELSEDIIKEFLASLRLYGITLSFFSGAWSPSFVRLVVEEMGPGSSSLLVIGAETIYSPAALKSFADTLVALLETIPGIGKTALVAAKKVYFGVGGSMEDFSVAVKAHGFKVDQVREESDGVRRGVVEVKFSPILSLE